MARVERSSKEFRKPKRCASGGHPRTVQGTTGVQSSFKVVHPLRASGADPADWADVQELMKRGPPMVRQYSILLLLSFFVGAEPLIADTVYAQRASFPSGPLCPCITSTNMLSGYSVWDNFNVTTDLWIGGVSWQGFFVDEANAGSNPVPPEPYGWEVLINSSTNDPNAPSYPFQNRVFTLGGGAAPVISYAGSHTFPPGEFSGSTVDVYDFSLRFDTVSGNPAAVHLTPGTYWISIYAASYTANPSFQWALGTGGDAQTLRFDSVQYTPSYFSGDRAFTVASGVPEPGTLCTSATALAFLMFIAVLRKHGSSLHPAIGTAAERE